MSASYVIGKLAQLLKLLFYFFSQQIWSSFFRSTSGQRFGVQTTNVVHFQRKVQKKKSGNSQQINQFRYAESVKLACQRQSRKQLAYSPSFNFYEVFYSSKHSFIKQEILFFCGQLGLENPNVIFRPMSEFLLISE